MAQTTNLLLPYIMAAQAQKHVTHNEALLGLDAIVQLSASSRSLSAPPATPADGDRYIVDGSATGSWLGKENKIAAWQDGGWLFYQPLAGWLCWVTDEAKLVAFDNNAWTDIAASGSALENAAKFGVNTDADSTNRLSVKTDAVLFSHDDVTPGSGDIRATLNKLATGNTASFLFQNAWSGRAEIGLAGNDDFHLKASQDGSNWKDALVVNAQTGTVRLPQNDVPESLVFNLFQDGGRFAGSPEVGGIIIAGHVQPSYFHSYNGATFSSHAKFIHNNTTYGGSSGPLDPAVDGLMTLLKPDAAERRFGPEFWVMNIAAGSGTMRPETIQGTTRYLMWTNKSAVLWPKSTWGLSLRVNTGSISISYDPDTYDLYVNGVEQSSAVVLVPADGWKQIVCVGTKAANASSGYDGYFFKIRGEPGSDVHIALPFLTPAQIIPKPGVYFGRIGSLEGWR